MFAFMITVQAEMPLQAPDHPAKKAPLAGTGVSFTLVPEAKEALHVGLQVMPAGVLVTVPVEVPASVTLSWNVVAGAASGCWAIEVVTKAVVRIVARIRIRWQFNRLDLLGRDRGLRFDGGERWAVGRENQVVIEIRGGGRRASPLRLCSGQAQAGRPKAAVSTWVY